MRCSVKHWHFLGIKIVCFLNDGLGTAKKYKIARVESNISAGFVINEKKSIWSPTTTITWLGILFDSVQYTFKITEKRKASILNKADKLLKNLPTYTPRNLAKFCGKIISTQYVLGHLVQLKTRRIFTAIKEGSGWDAKTTFENQPEAIKEIMFWKNNFVKLNLRQIQKKNKPKLKGTFQMQVRQVWQQKLKSIRKLFTYIKILPKGIKSKILLGVSYLQFIIQFFPWLYIYRIEVSSGIQIIMLLP